MKSKPADPGFEYSSPFVEKAVGYVHRVLAGEVIAGLFVKQACQRHLDDLVRSADPIYPYRFDEAKAHRVCWFISKMPHVKGKWAARVRGESPKIVLEPLAVLCAVHDLRLGKEEFRPSSFHPSVRRSAKEEW